MRGGTKVTVVIASGMPIMWNPLNSLPQSFTVFSSPGTEEWRKGQYSLNIYVRNEVRGGAKGTVGIVSGIPFSWNPFSS